MKFDPIKVPDPQAIITGESKGMFIKKLVLAAQTSIR